MGHIRARKRPRSSEAKENKKFICKLYDLQIQQKLSTMQGKTKKIRSQIEATE